MEMNGVVVEPALGEVVHAVAAFAGVQHVGNQHGVVIAFDLDAALREHQPVVFHVLRDFEDGFVLQERLEQRERLVLGDLVGAELGFRREQIGAVGRAAVAMADRHVAGFVRRHGERESAQMRLHRIEAGGLGVDRDDADFMRARDPGFQPRDRAHALVFAAVDLGVAGLLGARGGERNWR